MTLPSSIPTKTPPTPSAPAAARYEPRALRTYTPTQAVLARSAGVFHWTPEGRRLYDFTSGVLVANLGHNPDGVDAAVHRRTWAGPRAQRRPAAILPACR